MYRRAGAGTARAGAARRAVRVSGVALIWRDSETLFAIQPDRHRPPAGARVAAVARGGSAAGGAGRLRPRGPPSGRRHRRAARHRCCSRRSTGVRCRMAGRCRGCAACWWGSWPPPRSRRMFGGLLMDADPVFDQLMTAGARPSGWTQVAGHGFGDPGWDVARARARSGCSCSSPAERRPVRAAAAGRFGLIEVGTVLLVVDLLFLAFVLVQFRYLFGGDEFVRGITTMTLRRICPVGILPAGGGRYAVAAAPPRLRLGSRPAGCRVASTVPGARDGHARAAQRHARVGALAHAALHRRVRPDRAAALPHRVHGLAGAGLRLVRGYRAARPPERFGFGAIAAGLFVLARSTWSTRTGSSRGPTWPASSAGRAVDTAYLYSPQRRCAARRSIGRCRGCRGGRSLQRRAPRWWSGGGRSSSDASVGTSRSPGGIGISRPTGPIALRHPER